MIKRLSRISFAALAASLLLAGCSGPLAGDNGVKNAGVSDLVSKVKAAMATQKSVEVTGSGDLSGKTADFDFKFDLTHTTLTGSAKTSGGTMTMVFVNNHGYITMDKALAEQLLAASGSTQTGLADLFAGKCIDTGDLGSSGNPFGGGGGVSDLTSGNFIDSVFKDKTFTKGAVKTVNGTEVQPITDQDGNEYDIATHGDPLPVQAITKDTSSSSSGTSPSPSASTAVTTLTFKNWGTSVDASKPGNCVSLQDLMSSALGSGSAAALPQDTPTPSY